jgi:uncharacterized membrane protein (UPF0182 family)
MKTFPGTVQPESAISESLRSHFRYPEDQFKVQRELITSYHVDNPGEFFSNVSFWEVPSDPTPAGGAAGRAGAAAVLPLAGEPDGAPSGEPQFQLTSALVFQNRDILSAYMSASSDPETYGQITLLQLPPDTQELGPQQVQSRFVGTPEVSQELGLLARNGQSSVINGNLLTLPVAGGLLYVEPVYIQRANEDSSYPQLARVLTSYNGRVGFEPDLAGALDEVFGAGAGAAVPTPPGTPQAQGTTPPPDGTAVPGPGPTRRRSSARRRPRSGPRSKRCRRPRPPVTSPRRARPWRPSTPPPSASRRRRGRHRPPPPAADRSPAPQIRRPAGPGHPPGAGGFPGRVQS